MIARPAATRLVANRACQSAASYPRELAGLLGEDAARTARQTIAGWPGYAISPLRSLTSLARRTGVGELLYKDEAERFGLGSFKALGGAYAVLRLIQKLLRDRSGREIRSIEDLRSSGVAEQVRDITVCCATDGNHGRSVAWAAQLFGCRCVIFLHAGVSAGRQQAIERYGAEIRRVAGNYDDSVEAAAADAQSNGWYVISDTSYPGYTDVPLDVMAGYTVMVGEVLDQAKHLPTHVFLQGGVGGMAAAVAAHLWMALGASRPRIVVVEPDRADCLYRSAEAGRPVRVHGSLDTVMAGLACGEVSLVAWEILSQAASHFMTITDAQAVAVMRDVAHGAYGDPPLVAGESAVAGLAGFLAAMQDPSARAVLGLGANSRVLCFGTEGDTDPAIFEEITGTTAAAIRARRREAST